jgi:hypothetical protein
MKLADPFDIAGTMRVAVGMEPAEADDPVDGTRYNLQDVVRCLDDIVSAAPQVEGMRADDLQPGDWVIVRTRNSTYTLRANADGTFDAEGGWFARERESGRGLRIAGCTWGGSVLLTRMIAAPGMFLEFGNRVRTTRIREVRCLRRTAAPTIH